MSWFRVDDKFHSHPKVKGLKAVDPLGLWALCGSYCSDHSKLEGRVPVHVAADFAGSEAKARSIAAKLVARGLWVVDEDGWRFHDWHEYQPTAEETDERRTALSAKRASAGRLGAAKRWHQPSDANGKPMANDDGKHEAPVASDSPVPSRPDPVPSRPDPPPQTGGPSSVTPEAPAPAPPAMTPLSLGSASERAKEVYSEAVREAHGTAYGFTPMTTKNLIDAVNAHAPPGLRAAEFIPRLKYSVKRYVLDRGANPRLEAGFSPKRWLDWLNEGNAATLKNPPPPPVLVRLTRPPPAPSPTERAESVEIASRALDALSHIGRSYGRPTSGPERGTGVVSTVPAAEVEGAKAAT